MKKIFYYLRKVYYHRQIISNNRVYMKNGRYWLINRNGRMIWTRISFLEWIQNLTQQSWKILIRQLLFKHYYKVKNKLNQGVNDEILVTRRGGIKFFNYDNNTIVSVPVGNETDYSTFDWIIKMYAPIFSERLHICTNCLGTSENIIMYKEKCYKDIYICDKCVDFIFAGYEQYFDKCSICGCLSSATYEMKIKSICENGKIIELANKLQKKITKPDFKYSIYKLHNDVVFKNIFYSDNKFTIFDFEYFGENIFFFDILYWLVYEAVYNKNFYFFNNYMEGKYDEKINNLFKKAEGVFQGKNRIEYIYIVILIKIWLLVMYREEVPIKWFEEFVDGQCNEKD